MEQSQPLEESGRKDNNFADGTLQTPVKITQMCSVCDKCGFVSQSNSPEEFICKKCDTRLKTKEQF